MLGKAVIAHLRRERRHLATDAVITVTVTVLALVLGHEYRVGDWEAMDALGYWLICLGNIPILARRFAPMTVFVLCCAAWVVYIAEGYWPAMNVVGVEVALYTVAARRPRAVAAAATALMAATWIFAGVKDDNGNMASAAVLSLVVPGVIWRFGDNARQLAERNAQLATLTIQLRREQQDRAERAVMAEQMRIARELHDVVAHHTSVISVQAGLGRFVFDSDPATARAALDLIAGTAGEAHEELRRMLTLLRLGQTPAGPDEAPNPPAPGLDRLDELVDRFRTAGLPVEVTTVGDQRPLPSGLDLCAYRVVQEALTNVLKHARSAHATVALTFGPHQIEVRITDDGRASPRVGGPAYPVGRASDGAGPGGGLAGSLLGPGGAVSAGPAGLAGSLLGSGGNGGAGGQAGGLGQAAGLGLVGMRERVGLYGGRLTAGPRPTGGFEVQAVLPAPGSPT